MTEEEYLEESGYNDGCNLFTGILVASALALAVTSMKHISDSARKADGKPVETWKQWLLRGFLKGEE